MRLDILKGTLRQSVHHAGVASTFKPALRRLPGLQMGATASGGGGNIRRLQGTGDVLMALGTRMVVVDVSATHPVGVATGAVAAMTDGVAAAKHDGEKRRSYNRLNPNGYPFVPFSVETYGRLGNPAIALLERLGVEAAAAAVLGAVSKSAFVRSALCHVLDGIGTAGWLAWSRIPAGL
jgi:hypothetical protein